MKRCVVTATRDFTVGPDRRVVIRCGATRVVDLNGKDFWTTTDDGAWFGMCCIGDGWELTKPQEDERTDR